MVAIEIIGWNPDFHKQLSVEGGGQFKPSIIDPDPAIAMENEKVAHDVDKFLRGFIVFDVGKIEFGRYF